MAQQQNAGNLYETLAPVQRKAKQQFNATKDWFGERSTMQWILMILVPVLLVTAITGYFLYRNRSGSRKGTRSSTTRSRAKRSNIARQGVGLRRGRARGRRSRARGRAVATTGTAP